MKNNTFINIVIGSGQIGKALARVIPNNKNLTRRDLDFSDERLFKMQLYEALDGRKISSIVNAVAYTDVARAEVERNLAMNVNANCVKILADYCSKNDIPLIHYSTDFVFDGKKFESYSESDEPNPLNYYGYTKLMGERYIQDTYARHIIIRVAWVYSIFEKNNFIAKIIASAQNNSTITVIDDQIGSPSNAFDIAKCTYEVLCRIPNWKNEMNIKDSTRASNIDIFDIYHLCPKDFTSRFKFAKKIIYFAQLYCNNFNFDDIIITPSKTSHKDGEVIRPLNSKLNSNKIYEKFNISMKDWEYSLECAFKCLYANKSCK